MIMENKNLEISATYNKKYIIPAVEMLEPSPIKDYLLYALTNPDKDIESMVCLKLNHLLKSGQFEMWW